MSYMTSTPTFDGFDKHKEVAIDMYQYVWSQKNKISAHKSHDAPKQYSLSCLTTTMFQTSIPLS